MCNWKPLSVTLEGREKGQVSQIRSSQAPSPRSGSIKPGYLSHGKYPAQCLSLKRCLISITNSHSPKSYLEAPGSAFHSVNSTRGRKSIFLWTAHYHLLMVVHFEHITWTLIGQFSQLFNGVSNLCPAYLTERLCNHQGTCLENCRDMRTRFPSLSAIDILGQKTFGEETGPVLCRFSSGMALLDACSTFSLAVATRNSPDNIKHFLAVKILSGWDLLIRAFLLILLLFLLLSLNSKQSVPLKNEGWLEGTVGPFLSVWRGKRQA